MSTPSAQFLVAWAAKGTILLLVTAVIAAAASRARASMRHALWSAGLTALLLIPALSAALPRWQVVSLPPVVQAITPLALSNPLVPDQQSPTAAVRVPDAAVPARDAVLSGREDQARPEAVIPKAPGFDLSSSIVAVWAAGMGLVLSWLVVGHFRVGAIVRGSSRRLAPEWQESIDEVLAHSSRNVAVDFRETESSMPMAVGVFAPVVLLPTSGSAWTPAHRRNVVIHELAHVRRRDGLTHLTGRIACALHWFNPLAWLAARQARIEREHACDDAVLAAGALPSSYAQALLDTARQAPAAWATASAGLTMARPSHLANRLLAVLDQRRSRGRLGRFAFSAASFGTLALLAPVAALAPRKAAAPDTRSASALPDTLPKSGPSAHSEIHYSTTPTVSAASGVVPLERISLAGARSGMCQYNKHGSNRTVRLNGSVSISGMGSSDDGGGTAYVAWTGTDCSVVIKIQGTPAFTSDESDVASFAGSGRMTMTDSQGDQEREYDVRGSGSSLTRVYRMNRAEQPITEETRRWIGALVLQYIRQSGYQAEARANRILADKGMNGLLQEITAITSDYSRSKYYRAVLPSRKDPGEVSQLLDHTGANVDSDYEKGRVLAVVPPRLLGDLRVRASYLAVSKGLESDYEKSTALLAVATAGLDPASTQTALQASTTISSDYERARVLAAVVKTVPAAQDLDALYFDAAQAIESDYEKGRVLTIYAQHSALSAASLGRLYAAAATITSSNELANLLIATLASPGAAVARCDGYLTVAQKIDGDYDRGRALSGILAAGALPPACAKRAAAASATIESDNEHAQVLIDFLGKGLLTETTRPDFFRSASKLTSSNDRRRVLIAVLARGPVTEAVLGDLLESAGGIDSDNDLASVLVAAAGTGQISQALRPAYLKAAGHLSSDYEHRRAMTAIGERE